MSRKITVTTAQNVEIDYHIADAGERIVAYIIDGLIKFGYLILIFLLSSPISKLSSFGSSSTSISILLYVIAAIPIVFYSLIMEYMYNGQSFGKMAMKIQIVTLNGEPLTFSKILLRWLFRVIDFQIFWQLIGFIAVIASDKGQRIGDMVANTTAITLKRKTSVKNTSYVKVSPDYVPTYPEVKSLSNEDIESIKEVVRKRGDKSFELITETADHLQNILEVNKIGPSKQFLITLVKDYNYYQITEELDSESEFLDEY